jgi:type IV pilus assembly protein PilM
MAFGWSKPSVSPIAVDFGADSLKLLQLIPSDPPQLLLAASAEVPEHARQDPGARHAFFAEALKTLLKTQPFKGKRAICSIPAYQTLVQHLQIPKAEAAEDLEGQIHLQLRERLNVDPTRMVIRHFDSAQIVRDGANKQELICLAASRDAVMRHLETAQKAKLDVIGMSCEPVAVLRAFAHLFKGDGTAEKTTCFIDLGAATTKVLIAHGGHMVFAKTIHAAGDQITRHRAAAQKISFAEAREARICEASANAGSKTSSTPQPPAEAATATAVAEPPAEGSGFAMLDAQIAAERGTAPAPPKPPVQPTAPADSDTLDCLIDELQLSVRYHQSLFPGRNIDKLIFLGGEARHVSTCQKIARALRIGAQLGDPFARLLRVNQAGKGVGVDVEQPQPGWAVPVGLCLSEGNL